MYFLTNPYISNWKKKLRKITKYPGIYKNIYIYLKNLIVLQQKKKKKTLPCFLALNYFELTFMSIFAPFLISFRSRAQSQKALGAFLPFWDISIFVLKAFWLPYIIWHLDPLWSLYKVYVKRCPLVGPPDANKKLHGTVLEYTTKLMSHYFLFSSYHNTKLQTSNKNISTHTRLKF